MKYNFESKTAFFVESHEIEKILQDEFGFDEYSIVAAEELGNYMSLEYNLDGKLDDYDEKHLAEKRNQWTTRIYLNDLVRRDIMPKGTYVIDCSW